MCLTSGDNGKNALTEKTSSSLLPSIRLAELEKACKALGASLLPVQNFPDGKLLDAGTSSLARVIKRFIASQKPDILLTFGPDGLTGHPDHIATCLAATLAFEQVALPGSALFYAGISRRTVEGLSNRLEGKLGDLTLKLVGLPDEEIQVIIDINQTACYKWEALACHRSQAGSFAGLNHADRQLLGAYECFRLAQIAGKKETAEPAFHRATDLMFALTSEAEEVAA